MSSTDALDPVYAITSSGLTKRYGHQLAVDQVDLRIPAGVVAGFVGPNGAGKSTIIRTLLGIGNLILASLGWALIGTLLAVLFRSPAPAIATGAAYALPGEALLVGSWDDAAQWLPRSLMDALAAGGTPLVSYGHAATLLALYGSVAFLLIVVLFVRRDVTA